MVNMQELEKILEEIEQAKREPWYRLSNYDVKHKLDGAINRIVDIIRKHMNDGWIPCIERMPTKKECENNYFWIMLKYNASPVIAKCDWIESENNKGNDDSFSEFFIDQYPQIYTPSKDIVIAWKIAGVPEPYRSERSEGE